MSTIPRGMLPITAFGRPVEVVTAPTLVMDGDKPKTKDTYPGCSGYRMIVEAVVGWRTKTVVGGNKEKKEFQAPELFSHSVTVWSDRQPQCAPGDQVYLENLAAGTIDRSFYLTATGVEKIDFGGDEK